jgi:divalent metal cation (Fe/Co/Zn/Cd) transporter
MYLVARSVLDLLSGAPPEASIPGIVLACVSLVVMPTLARRKRLVAQELDSRALQADSTQTSLCVWLSAVLLAGLGLNGLAGWWWADPAAGAVIGAFALKEGWELWRGEDSCCARGL